MAPAKVRTLGCTVDVVTLEEATQVILGWIASASSAKKAGHPLPPCRYLVTPNLDHAVLLSKPGPLRDAYQGASLVVADGMPLVWASRLFRRPLPERVAGSDLGPAVLEKSPLGTKVFFLGATDESSERAVQNVKGRYPQLDVVGRLSPPLGFEGSSEWSDTIVGAITASEATLVIVGLGAPKQELWVHRHAERLPGTAILCLGATIDFLAGTVARAPVWAQKMGVEWVHRMLSNPRRLAKRYGKDALALPGLLVRDALSRDR